MATAAETAARNEVEARALGMCEVCGLRPGHDYQHRKARTHCTRDERWDPRNGLFVCGFGNTSGCHGIIHNNPTVVYDMGWSVPSHMDPARRRVCRRAEWVLLVGESGEIAVIDPADYPAHEIGHTIPDLSILGGAA